MLLVAAIAVIIIAIVIPVSAVFIQNGVSNKIVQFYEDHFNIDLRQGSTKANHYSDKNVDLIQELQKRGFSNVILPADLLKYRYSEDIGIQEGDYLILATITIDDPESEIHGAIGITQYNELISPAAGSGLVSSMYTHVVQLNVNGLDVLVFGNDDKASIIYVDNNTDYSITLDNCDFDTAIKIANSLK